MVIEAGEAASGEELAEVRERGLVRGIFAAILFCGSVESGKPDMVHIRKAQSGKGQGAGERQLRKSVLVISAAEFVLFDGGDDAAIVEKSDRGVWSWRGDAEDAH